MTYFIPGIDTVRYWLGYSDYHHDEINGVAARRANLSLRVDVATSTLRGEGY